MCLGIPAEIVETFDARGVRMAVIEAAGVRRKACLEYTPEAGPGDHVILHCGFAVSVVTKAQAALSRAVLAEARRALTA